MEVTSKPSSDSSCVIQGFAVLVGIVFVVVTVMVLIAIPSEARLFNPNVYKHAIQSQDLYAQLPGLLGELAAASKMKGDNDAGDVVVQEQSYSFSYSFEEGFTTEKNSRESRSIDGQPDASRYLSQEDFTFIIGELFPPEWMQAQTESLIDQTFAFYNTTSPTAKIELSLTELKSRLGGEEGVRALQQLVRSWPLCTTEAEQQAWDAIADPDAPQLDEMPECRPPDNVLEAATPELENIFDEMVAAMPETADLTPKYLPDPEATGNDPRPTLLTIRWIIKLSPLISLGLLAVVTILVVRSFKELLGWWGTLFLCVGVGTFLLAAVSGLMVEGMIETVVTGATSQSEAEIELIVAILEAIRYILRGAGIQISILAGLSGLMGLTMAVTAFFAGDKKNTDPYLTAPF